MTTCPVGKGPQYEMPVPDRMKGLPRDHRGFIIPFFVAWLRDGKEVNPGYGEADFRVISTQRRYQCVRDRRCWVCGEPLGRYLVFAVGPMCVINRTTAEPPAHLECAEYSVKVCPFLSRPRMKRNEVDMPEGRDVPGIMIDRNPGVTALYVARSYRIKQVPGGDLIRMDEPLRVDWWREGRPATRAEAIEAIESGLPILRDIADREGEAARRDLEEQYIPRVQQWLPSEG